MLRPTQNMLNVMGNLCLEEIENVLSIPRSTTLASQATELFNHRSTSHLERLLLTTTISIVNQNAMLIRQMEELKEKHFLATEKTAIQISIITNEVDKTCDHIST